MRTFLLRSIKHHHLKTVVPDWADLNDRLDAIPEGDKEDALSNDSYHLALQKALTYIVFDDSETRDCGYSNHKFTENDDEEIVRPDALQSPYVPTGNMNVWNETYHIRAGTVRGGSDPDYYLDNEPSSAEFLIPFGARKLFAKIVDHAIANAPTDRVVISAATRLVKPKVEQDHTRVNA